MLISVFGLWLMAANITWLDNYSSDCAIYFAAGKGGGIMRSEIATLKGHSCSEVAAEVNRQIKESQK